MTAAFPKDQRVADPAYLEWLRRKPCAFCQAPGGEAHHVILKGMGGATQRDDVAVAACRSCHMRCHGQTVVQAGGARRGPIPVEDQKEAARRMRDAFLADNHRARRWEMPW